MTQHARKHLILVVDDTPDNIHVLGEIMRPEYDVKAATRGDKALQIARAHPKPDMILLDIMMPSMDGYEVCRQLKADPTTTDIPVIFITAKSEVRDEQRGFEVGAVDYISKPVSPPLVLARVATHLELVEKRHNLEVLLKKTLIGIIGVLTDLLAISNPTAFQRVSRLKRFMRELTQQLRIPDTWQFEVAAMLSHLGCISMSPQMLTRLFSGAEVSDDARQQYRQQFARSARVLEEIPNLKNVAKMLYGLEQQYGSQPTLATDEATDVVALGTQLLNTVLYYDDLMQQENSNEQAGKGSGETDQPRFDIEALDILDGIDLPLIKRRKPLSAAVNELKIGMIVAEDVYARDNLLVLPGGLEITETVLEHLRDYDRRVGLVEPLAVYAADTTSSSSPAGVSEYLAEQ